MCNENAAPEMAAMIAGMRPEYRAEYQAAGGRWFPVPHCCNCGGEEWGTKEQAERNAAAWKADDYAVRVVRRYVTEPEEISLPPMKPAGPSMMRKTCERISPPTAGVPWKPVPECAPNTP